MTLYVIIYMSRSQFTNETVCMKKFSICAKSDLASDSLGRRGAKFAPGSSCALYYFKCLKFVNSDTLTFKASAIFIIVSMLGLENATSILPIKFNPIPILSASCCCVKFLWLRNFLMFKPSLL